MIVDRIDRRTVRSAVELAARTLGAQQPALALAHR